MISIEGLSKTFDTQRNRPYLAITDIDLKVADGEFVSILGPSGCGKSTLLYIVGGFVPPSTGAVLVDGKPVDGPGPDRGPVFQEFALFPWKTVLGNVMYGLLEQGQSRKAAEARARVSIDEQLVAAGWVVQDRSEMNLAASRGVAVRVLAWAGAPLPIFRPARREVAAALLQPQALQRNAARRGIELLSTGAQRDLARPHAAEEHRGEPLLRRLQMQAVLADQQADQRLLGLLDLHLRGNACMVGTEDPLGVLASHARTADQYILDRTVERMPHMQRPGYVGRRNRNRVVLVGAAGCVGAEDA